MFKDLKSLDRIAHRALRFDPNQPYYFAAELMVSPIMSSEAALVARDYPIVFGRTAAGLPMALLGVRQDVNAYVSPGGVWQARYIPAHVRRYPFMLADSAPAGAAEGERSFAVMIDTAAPHLAGLGGVSLFNPAGEPTEALEKVRNILVNLQRDAARTEKLVAQIDAAGLLVEQSLTGQPKTGKPFELQGFRVVDTGRLAACAPDTLRELVQSGAMSLVYAQLHSMTNLQDGPLLESNERTSMAQEAAAATALLGDTINLSGLR